MNRIFRISATLPNGETVIRELRCKTEEKAVRLMKTKFSEAVSVRLVDHQEETIDDMVDQESTRVESRLRELDEMETKCRQRKNRGLVALAFGAVATIALFFYGWIAWFTLLPIAVGIYEFSNGSWGEKRARRLRSWEMEELES